MPVPDVPSEHTQVLNVPPQPAPVPSPTPVTDPRPPTDERRSPWLVVLLVLALVAAIVLIIVVATRGDDDGNDDPAGSDTSSAPTSSAPTTEDTPTEETSAAPAEVQINEGDYLGRNVDAVATELRAKGLEVDTQPIDNPDGEEADSVASVRPTTGLVEGDTVTVEYYREADADLRAADQRAHVGSAVQRAHLGAAVVDGLRHGHRDPDHVRPGRAGLQIE